MVQNLRQRPVVGRYLHHLPLSTSHLSVHPVLPRPVGPLTASIAPSEPVRWECIGPPTLPQYVDAGRPQPPLMHELTARSFYYTPVAQICARHARHQYLALLIAHYATLNRPHSCTTELPPDARLLN